MDSITEANIARLNRLFESELGLNPPFSWRWSEDLTYLRAQYDATGAPVYETLSHGALLVRVQAKEVAKIDPDLANVWVCCQLAHFPESGSGAIHGTGDFAWVPVGAGIAPLALDPDEVPTREVTLRICQRIREARRTAREKLEALEESQRDSVPLDESINSPKFKRLVTKQEKKQYDEALDQIQNEHTAFLSIPGQKAHVSFPSVQEKTNGSSSSGSDSGEVPQRAN